MINAIHHVALAVADLDGAARFYRAAAGLAPWHEADAGLPLPPDAAASCMLAGANGALRLLATPQLAPQAVPVWKAGITHFCLQGVDAPGLYASLATAGASFHSELVDLGTGYLYCYARDPEHNVIELEGVAPVWPQTTPWFAHVALSTPDIDRLAGFYAGALGAERARSPRFRHNRKLDRIAAAADVDLSAAWLASSNMQVEMMQYFHPATEAHRGERAGGTGYRYIAFEVDDAAAELARLQDLGATALPADPGAARPHALCTDPDGNLLMLLQPDASARIANLPDPDITARLLVATRRLRQKDRP